MRRAIIGCLAIAVAGGAAMAGGSGPQPITQYETPSEARWAPFSADLPACGEASVLSTISGRFGTTETEFWGGRASIDSFDRVREIGFRANGLDYIPRRYCVAQAAVLDPRVPAPVAERPKPHTVIYNVIAGGGIIGIPWGVEWCVVGFDREHAYEPACAVLRPILERWLGEPKGAAWLKARD